MAGAKKSSANPGMSDAAVAAQTGKTWPEWLRTLDREDAAGMTHREIAEHLRKKHGMPSWWTQMVTVGYERLKGRRLKGETAAGFSISANRTIAVPVARLFAAWNDAAKRRSWLRGDKLEISTATASKSLRAAWAGGPSRVAVMFYPKGAKKSSVAVEHMKLTGAKEAVKMKAYWAKQLDSLETHLEK
jgi:hypothetical protein